MEAEVEIIARVKIPKPVKYIRYINSEKVPTEISNPRPNNITDMSWVISVSASTSCVGTVSLKTKQKSDPTDSPLQIL
jgi:hypothetical protein